MATAMTIAGSDSGGGAGIQADLKTFAALGVYGTSAITAITAQNTLGVFGIVELDPEIIAQQIDAIVTDIGADAVKTGMLSSAVIIETVAAKIQEHGLRRLVVDPVMVAKGGEQLLQPSAVSVLRERLLPLAYVLTPNIPEAEVLTGRKITSEADMRTAAQALHALGAANVVVKGGHLEGPATDYLYDGERFHAFTADRVRTKNSHGTGCTFASAIAAGLAKGEDVVTAVGQAKRYLTEAIRHAYNVGHGRGPVHHFWQCWEMAAGGAPPAGGRAG
jgi:hydroxymethylpyrimidine/phosphomethylpyrimidine kinase